MTTKTILRRLLGAAFASALALPASAQWGPEEEKNCFLRGKKGTLTLSGQANSAQGDSSKLEQYEEIPKGVLVPCAAYSWSNEKYFFDAKTIDVGYDDMFLGGLFGRKGGFLLDVSWEQNPNWQTNTARSLYTETARGVFDFPDSVRLALQNVYVPWVPPTSSNPVGTGSGPANPTVPGFFQPGSEPQGRFFAPATCAALPLKDGDCAPDLYFTGRWFAEFDFRIVKKFPIGRRATFELAAELFNAFNAVNFDHALNPTSNNPFRITSGDSPERRGQLVWRVSW